MILAFVIKYDLPSQTIEAFNNHLTNTNQVLFVKTPSANSIRGTMFLCERKNSKRRWELADSFAIVVGRNGMAKDAHAEISFNNDLPIKHEGDGKSPAGIFQIGSVFSYHNLKKLNMPFVQVDTNYYCVDDALHLIITL